MLDLSTRYMKLNLRSPIIVASCGLTGKLENLMLAEKYGAGAVVMKSIFEEHIKYEIHKTLPSAQGENYYPEAEKYISKYAETYSLDSYLKLITEAKKHLTIPLIASINCVTSHEWTEFARRIQDAGADAIELNIFLLPSNHHYSSEQNEQFYFDIVREVRKHISIPIAVKTSYYFSGLAKMALKLSWTGIEGIVMFNRFFAPDIDIDNFTITPAYVFSRPEDMVTSLRWVAVLSDRLHCDIAASTGIHEGAAVIKQLLAGAKAVQVASVIYKKGFEYIPVMLNDIEIWMNKHKFANLNEFSGKMSYGNIDNPASLLRIQFMKNFSDISNDE